MSKCHDNSKKRLRRCCKEYKRREERLLKRIFLHFAFMGKEVTSYKRTKHKLQLSFYDSSGAGNKRNRTLTIINFSDFDHMESLWSKDGVHAEDDAVISYDFMEHNVKERKRKDQLTFD